MSTHTWCSSLSRVSGYPTRNGRVYATSCGAGETLSRTGIVLIYWEFETEFEYTFELQPEVEQRIQELARRAGVAETLCKTWQLHELDPGRLSDLTEVVGEIPDRNS